MAKSRWSRALLGQYLKAVVNYWYWLVGSGVLTVWDIVERSNADWYTFRRLPILIGALVCLFVAQFLAYADIAIANEKLEKDNAELSDGVEVTLTEVRAHEILNHDDSRGKSSHYVSISLRLTIRNHNGREAAAVELVGCDTNIQQGTLSLLIFQGDPLTISESRASTNRRIPEGDILKTVVLLQFSMPDSETHALVGGVSGTLRLADNRANTISVPLNASVSLG
jgi:hypothetical protein